MSHHHCISAQRKHIILKKWDELWSLDYETLRKKVKAMASHVLSTHDGEGISWSYMAMGTLSYNAAFYISVIVHNIYIYMQQFFSLHWCDDPLALL